MRKRAVNKQSVLSSDKEDVLMTRKKQAQADARERREKKEKILSSPIIILNNQWFSCLNLLSNSVPQEGMKKRRRDFIHQESVTLTGEINWDRLERHIERYRKSYWLGRWYLRRFKRGYEKIETEEMIYDFYRLKEKREEQEEKKEKKRQKKIENQIKQLGEKELIDYLRKKEKELGGISILIRLKVWWEGGDRMLKLFKGICYQVVEKKRQREKEAEKEQEERKKEEGTKGTKRTRKERERERRELRLRHRDKQQEIEEKHLEIVKKSYSLIEEYYRSLEEKGEEFDMKRKRDKFLSAMPGFLKEPLSNRDFFKKQEESELVGEETGENREDSLIVSQEAVEIKREESPEEESVRIYEYLLVKKEEEKGKRGEGQSEEAKKIRKEALEQLRKFYHRLALENHPDHCQEAGLIEEKTDKMAWLGTFNAEAKDYINDLLGIKEEEFKQKYGPKSERNELLEKVAEEMKQEEEMNGWVRSCLREMYGLDEIEEIERQTRESLRKVEEETERIEEDLSQTQEALAEEEKKREEALAEEEKKRKRIEKDLSQTQGALQETRGEVTELKKTVDDLLAYVKGQQQKENGEEEDSEQKQPSPQHSPGPQ